MNSAAILAKELADLKQQNKKEKRKSKRSRCQMTPNEGLSIQEGRDLIQQRNEYGNEQGNAVEAIPDSSAPIALNARKRAPPTCSDCHIKGHIRKNCPTRENSQF